MVIYPSPIPAVTAAPAAVAGSPGGSDQSAHQTLQRRRIGCVRERVAGDVDDVLGAHLQAVEGVERVPGLGPGGGHERTLAHASVMATQ